MDSLFFPSCLTRCSLPFFFFVHFSTSTIYFYVSHFLFFFFSVWLPCSNISLQALYFPGICSVIQGLQGVEEKWKPIFSSSVIVPGFRKPFVLQVPQVLRRAGELRSGFCSLVEETSFQLRNSFFVLLNIGYKQRHVTIKCSQKKNCLWLDVSTLQVFITSYQTALPPNDTWLWADDHILLPSVSLTCSFCRWLFVI